MWPNILAHALPLEPGEGGHAPLVLALTTLGVLLATLGGILAGNLAQRRAPLLAAAAAAGALILLLHDLLKESATLGQGILANIPLILALLALFAAGLLLIPRLAETSRASLAWLWTAGILAHTLGEGLVLGSEAPHVELTGVAGIASFLIHKAIEAATIPLVAGTRVDQRDAWAMPGALALATLAAAAWGLTQATGNLPLLCFAAGAGATLYAILRLANRSPPTLRIAASALLGFLLVYAAGLLHET